MSANIIILHRVTGTFVLLHTYRHEDQQQLGGKLIINVIHKHPDTSYDMWQTIFKLGISNCPFQWLLSVYFNSCFNKIYMKRKQKIIYEYKVALKYVSNRSS